MGTTFAAMTDYCCHPGGRCNGQIISMNMNPTEYQWWRRVLLPAAVSVLPVTSVAGAVLVAAALTTVAHIGF